MKILIFGANGFVGPYLINEFLNNGYEVVASDVQDAMLIDGFRGSLYGYRTIGYKKCDLLSSESVLSLIRETRPDGIVNLAAISSVGQSWSIPALTMQINVIGTINILEAVKQTKNKSTISDMSSSPAETYDPGILLIGSSEEYRMSDEALNEDTTLDASNPYGISKVAQEQYAELYHKNYGIRIAYVRAFNHTGVGQRDTFVLPSFCKQAAEIEKSGESGTIAVGNLNVNRDFSDVRDIVRGYRLVYESLAVSEGDTSDKDNISENDGAIPVYNIGSEKAYNLGELLDYICTLSSQKILIKIDPAKYRPIDQKTVLSDTTLIREKLGWKPDYDIYETLKELFDYYKNL